MPFREWTIIIKIKSGQYSIYGWSKGHRTHHKYSDTDADPHNVKRGFCFSHMGWMVQKEHPLCDVKGNGIDFTDILADPVCQFQENHFAGCHFWFSIALPTATHLMLYGGSPVHAFFISYVLRYFCTMHGTLFVNSASHMFGEKPYNDKIASSQNPWVAFGSLGEGKKYSFNNLFHI